MKTLTIGKYFSNSIPQNLSLCLWCHGANVIDEFPFKHSEEIPVPIPSLSLSFRISLQVISLSYALH